MQGARQIQERDKWAHAHAGPWGQGQGQFRGHAQKQKHKVLVGPSPSLLAPFCRDDTSSPSPSPSSFSLPTAFGTGHFHKKNKINQYQHHHHNRHNHHPLHAMSTMSPPPQPARPPLPTDAYPTRPGRHHAGEASGGHEFFKKIWQSDVRRDREGRVVEQDERRRRMALRNNLMQGYTVLSCCCPCIVKRIVDRKIKQKLGKLETATKTEKKDLKDKMKMEKKAKKAEKIRQKNIEKLEKKGRIKGTNKLEEDRAHHDDQDLAKTQVILTSDTLFSNRWKEKKDPGKKGSSHHIAVEKPHPVLTGPPDIAGAEQAILAQHANPNQENQKQQRKRVKFKKRKWKQPQMLPGESNKSWEWTGVEIEGVSDDDTDFEHGTTTLMQQTTYPDFSSVERMSQDSALFKLEHRQEGKGTSLTEVINLYEHLFESTNRLEGVMDDFGEGFATCVFKTNLGKVVQQSKDFYLDWFMSKDMVPKELNKDTEISVLNQLNPRKTLEDMPVILVKMKVLSKLVSDDWESERVPRGATDLNARFADVHYLIGELLSDVHAVMLRLNIPFSEDEEKILIKDPIWLPITALKPTTLRARMERDWVVYRDSRNLVQHWVDYFHFLTHRDKGHLRLAGAFNRKGKKQLKVVKKEDKIGPVKHVISLSSSATSSSGIRPGRLPGGDNDAISAAGQGGQQQQQQQQQSSKSLTVEEIFLTEIMGSSSRSSMSSLGQA